MNNTATPRLRTAAVLSAVVLTVLLLWMLKETAHAFLLLFISVIISLYLGQVTDVLTRRAHLPERVAFLTALIGTIGVLVVILWVLVPPVITQTQQLINVLPDYFGDWEKRLAKMMARFGTWSLATPGHNQVGQMASDFIISRLQMAPQTALSMVRALIDVFSVIVMSIYLALRPGIYREWLIALFPPIHRDFVRDILRDLATTLRAYVTAQLFTMAVLSALTATGLYFLGVEYWLTFGVFTGLVSVIPFFGTLLSTSLPALFALNGPNGGTRALMVMAWGIVVHLTEGNVLSPLVMAHKVELPPVLTIMAVLVIGAILGPLGLVIAVPALAALMVVVRRIVINRIYEGQGFRRVVRDRSFTLRVPVPEGGVLTHDGEAPDVVAFLERDTPKLPTA